MIDRLIDGGPYYAETLMGRFPVEPWNASSNLIFLFLVILFAFKTKLNFKEHPFTVCALPVLFVGFIGGTMYHATRSHRVWLLLDFLPIAILTLSSSVYFWKNITGKLLSGILLGIAPVAIVRGVMSATTLPILIKISFGYTMLAVSVILPALLVCRKFGWKNFKLLILAISSFVIGIFFRYADTGFGEPLLPFGTHFIWHLAGGAATWALMEFVVRFEKERR